MNGIDNIINTILDNAKNDAKITEYETKKQIKVVREKVEFKVAESIKEIQEIAMGKGFELQMREKTMMELEVRRNILSVKREMVDMAFDSAYEHLCNLSDSEHDELIISLLAHACDTSKEIVMGGSDQRIGQKIVDKANEQLKVAGKAGELKLSKEYGNFKGGFILIDGGIETNVTFKMMIRQNKSKLEGKVVQILSVDK